MSINYYEVSIEDALGLPVDIIPLNWASPKLKLKALLNSVKLIVGDSNIYTSLIKEALSEAIDLDLKIKYMEKMHY